MAIQLLLCSESRRGCGGALRTCLHVKGVQKFLPGFDKQLQLPKGRKLSALQMRFKDFRVEINIGAKRLAYSNFRPPLSRKDLLCFNNFKPL